MSGRPHDAGDAHAALESGSFAIAEGKGGAAVVLEAKPWAVVGGEDDEGVLGDVFSRKVVMRRPTWVSMCSMTLM